MPIMPPLSADPGQTGETRARAVWDTLQRHVHAQLAQLGLNSDAVSVRYHARGRGASAVPGMNLATDDNGRRTALIWFVPMSG
jgi:hypothetical protein